ncbi:uncharacterized protein LOC113165212 isoform X2 [Anabas testudineus]|uniref:uncharacterized protein LOC113165212 isoform X2 n=1 Tax=Anabas testudineus TaxID=64144 RepID=UPI000E45D2CC|nr:uncharacterized protein LOC113165212 isoform X2 [Anabas testudineus]
MKTLCFTLVLLLFTVYCCDAGPPGLLSTDPVSCCFDFFTLRIPKKFIHNITKTHSSCLTKGFIVLTERGRKICYRHDFKWNLNPYNEGSVTQLSKAPRLMFTQPDATKVTLKPVPNMTKTQSSAHVAADFIHGTCCFDFSTVRIRKKHMIKITKTHSDCPTRGFIWCFCTELMSGFLLGQ